MTPEEAVSDSPTRWVAQHVRGYVETDGKKGHRWRGVNTLFRRPEAGVPASSGGRR
jgi:hypothetical protein